MSLSGPQRQRHGVTKKWVEGIGGVVVGAAVVLAVARLLRGRSAPMATSPSLPADSNGDDGKPPKSPAKGRAADVTDGTPA
ncbi:carbon monoxide dehydrogenase [Endothiovibrio diazotrophicus]